MASMKSQLHQLEDEITNISYIFFSTQAIIFASLFGQFMEAKCSSFFLPFLLSFFAGAFSLNAIVWKILSLKKILDEIAQPPPQSQSPPTQSQSPPTQSPPTQSQSPPTQSQSPPTQSQSPPPETLRFTQTHLQPQEAAIASSSQQTSTHIMRPPSPSPPPPETAGPALSDTEVSRAYKFDVMIPLFLSTGFFLVSLFACWYIPCRFSAPAAAAATPAAPPTPLLYVYRR